MFKKSLLALLSSALVVLTPACHKKDGHHHGHHHHGKKVETKENKSVDMDKDVEVDGDEIYDEEVE